jgi:integrase
MAGRPPLRIGQHGKITRTEIEKGMWIARCRYRDTDGVTRVVERKSPSADQHGKKAEDLLIESLATRQAPGGGDINQATKVADLIRRHIDRLREDGKADRTIDTYNFTAGKLAKLIGGLRVSDATPPRIDAALRSMKTAHGLGMTRQALVLFRGGLQLAVMAGVLPTNPTRDVPNGWLDDGGAKGAKAVPTGELADLMEKLNASEFCRYKDLVDPITMYAATGLRRSELLGLRWVDYNPLMGSVTVTGKLVRVKGKGLKWVPKPKTKAGFRTIVLPLNAREMLARRKATPYYGQQSMVFPSTAGTWRDPDNFNKDWRQARADLGFPDITGHSFRKGMATLIDEGGLSARVGADHLGHANVSMTQNVYMARGKEHPEVAALIEKAMVRSPTKTDE